jgi:hypothetical protein
MSSRHPATASTRATGTMREVLLSPSSRLIIRTCAAGTGSALDEAAWVWKRGRQLVFEVAHQPPVPPRLGRDTASMPCRQGLAAMLCHSNRHQTKGDLGRRDGVSVQIYPGRLGNCTAVPRHDLKPTWYGLVLGSTVGCSRRHGIRRRCRQTCDAKGRFRLFPMLPPLLGISVCACLAWELVSHQDPNRCQHLRLHMQQPPTEGHATMLQPRGTEGPRTKASSG